ncbi:MAG: MBL fold metallo-hydrolase [Betaproteobacteria bacterium]|nr:MBL fold metallo-hydrolase [Betaproteobacteria bacterium]HAB48264.1 MBL fold metallo-hydrolase [Lautropia sp.]NBP34599.1 MBL fold metallo-hydrolase [Betaproteobacteria bacterium]NBP37087.1 MBL fold metallo-hydrolase [Betaproteobacteria bacterium]NBQ78141.1 MBL fold metallo-hydrolase [Betaproteobacteria bacterium]
MTLSYRFRWSWLVLLLAVTPLFAQSMPLVALQALSKQSYMVQGDLGPASTSNRGFNANAGIVITDKAVILIDALGTPALAEELLASIRAMTDLPISDVIVTHYHADHYYGLQVFKQLGARIIAARPALQAIGAPEMAERFAERKVSLSPWVDESFRVIAPDLLIDRAMRMQLGGAWFGLIPAGPAHTPEDLMVLSEADGVLFAGDLMFAGRIPFVGNANTKAWIKGIEDLIRAQPKVIVGGHGPASLDAANDLVFTLQYLKHLRATMGAAVQDLKSFDEAYAEIDWSRYRGVPAFDAAHRRNAYNVFLSMEQEALRP